MNKYIFKSIIGTGGYGVVYKTECIQTKKNYAIKVIDISDISEKEQKKVWKEVSTSKLLRNHHNIVNFIEVFEGRFQFEDVEYKRAICIVLELAFGDLCTVLEDKGGLEDDVIHSYFKQIVNAVEYCHDNSIAHRDLKPENVLMYKEGVKICDFGVAKKSDDDKYHEIIGTEVYRAPEITVSDDGYGKNCDIWSIGVILFVMATGNLPFTSPDKNDWNFDKLLTSKYSLFWEFHSKYASNYISDNLKDILNKLLQPDPSHRISIAGIKKHPYWNPRTSE